MSTLSAGLAAHRQPAPAFGRLTLGALFLLLIVSYAAIGRDVFFNRLQASNVDDPIGANLVYIRCLVAACCLGIVWCRSGFETLIRLFPLGWLPFVIFALISAGWAEESKTSAREALQLAAFIWAVSCCVSALGKETVFGLLAALCGCCLVLSAFVALAMPGIGVHSGTEFMQFSHSGRWKGIFVHKNALGFWAALSTMWFALLLIHKRVPFFVGGFVLGCSALCVIFAGSSTAAGMLLLMAVAYAVLSLRHRVSAEVFGLVSVLLVSIGYLIKVYLLDGIFELLGRDAGLSGRVDLWTIALDTFVDAPLTGQGYSSSGGSVFNGLASQYLGTVGTGVESSYLTLALDTGLIGTVLFVAPVCFWVWTGLRRDTPSGAGAFEGRAILLLALGALILGYTEATAFSATTSVGAMCLTAFLVLRWQAVSGSTR